MERTTHLMYGNLSQQTIEHAITTMYTCRSILKYNAALTSDQKEALLADIDASLRLLQEGLANSSAPSVPPTTQPLVPQTTSASRSSPNPHTPRMASTVPQRATGAGRIPDPQKSPSQHKYLPIHAQRQEHEQSTLYLLYQFYHTYITVGQGKGIEGFITRFTEVTAALDRLEFSMTQRGGRSASSAMGGHMASSVSFEEPLHHIKEFIADLYYMFMELIRSLSTILQENDIHLDTEEMASLMHGYRPEPRQNEDEGNIIPLMEVYAFHQRLEGQGVFSKKVNDARAFLAFLGERLLKDSNRRDEIIVRLSEASGLLNDLSQLLFSYDCALSTFLGRQ